MIAELTGNNGSRISLPVFWGYYEVLRRDFPIYVVVALQMATATLFSVLLDVQAHVHPLSYPSMMANALAVPILVYFTAAIIVMAIQREPSPIGRSVVVATNWMRNLPEVLGLFFILVTFVLFVSAFSSVKAMIPLIQPFELDPLFFEIDRTLHAGINPWKITHAIFSSAAATAMLNFFYILWFFILWGMFLYFMLKVDSPQMRLHYLLAQVMTWSLLGSAAAILLSSAGPCYYGHVVPGDNPFAPLMDLLNAQNEALIASSSPIEITALRTQSTLWDLYTNSKTSLGSGISAMPSMHIASTVIMALGAMRLNRWLGTIGWIFVGIILIGSVHLGWHYAIDGYFSIAAALGLWKLSGWISRWWLSRTHEDLAPPSLLSTPVPEEALINQSSLH